MFYVMDAVAWRVFLDRSLGMNRPSSGLILMLDDPRASMPQVNS